VNPGHQLFSLVMLLLIALVTAGYLVAVWQQWARGRRWSWLRVNCWLGGSLLLGIGLVPGVIHQGHLDLRWHMGQHMLLAMLAPLLLVLAAPATLLLRSLPVTAARPLARLFSGALSVFFLHPVTALVLNVGGMYLLYATPLYAASLQSAALHHLVHLHFILAGYLFCQAVLGGPDRMAHRVSGRLRLAALLGAIAAHSVLSKLMYGYHWPVAVGYPAAQIEAAAQLMYYSGALVEMLLLGLLLAGGRLTRNQPLPLVRV